jgi:hypothetical protein
LCLLAKLVGEKVGEETELAGTRKGRDSWTKKNESHDLMQLAPLEAKTVKRAEHSLLAELVGGNAQLEGGKESTALPMVSKMLFSN